MMYIWCCTASSGCWYALEHCETVLRFEWFHSTASLICWLVASGGSVWMVLATLVPQLSSSSSLYTLPWCSFTSASVCSNQSKQ